MKKWPSLSEAFLAQGIPMELDKDELKRFQEAMKKYDREYREKQIRSIESARRVILTR